MNRQDGTDSLQADNPALFQSWFGWETVAIEDPGGSVNHHLLAFLPR